MYFPKLQFLGSFLQHQGVTNFENSFMMLLLTFLPSHPSQNILRQTKLVGGSKKQQILFTYNY